MSLLIVDAEVSGRTTSVRVSAGVIEEIGGGLTARSVEDVIDARGGALIPGLHDHHLHLRAALAAAGSERLGPPDVVDRAEFRRRLALSGSRARPREWVRGVGYHESVAGLPDRWELDDVVREVPVRIQHRSGALWLLNSSGVERLRITDLEDPAIERDEEGAPTGRLWRGDHLLRQLLSPDETDPHASTKSALPTQSASPTKSSASTHAFAMTEASYGVTGFTDATPGASDVDFDWFVESTESGALPLNVHVMRPIGSPIERHGHVSTGPVKVLLDDGDLPDLDEFADLARSAYSENRRVAVHCVTRSQIVLTLAALRAARSPGGDRIEHGGIIPTDLDQEMASLGVVVVTQPNFVKERGDQYLHDLGNDDVEALYRCGTLIEKRVGVAAGTDAPFGGSDPWVAVRAAVERRTESGQLVGPKERVSALRALELFLGEPEHPERKRAVTPGARANLCLLAAPLEPALRDLTSEVVRMTIADGLPVFGE
jgi:predicted amidohydrolase YtcJ